MFLARSRHFFICSVMFILICPLLLVFLLFFLFLFFCFLFFICAYFVIPFLMYVFVGSRLKRERFVSVRPESETMRRSRTSASPPWPHFIPKSPHMPASAHWNTADTTGSTRLQTHRTHTNRTPATDTPLQQTGIYCNNNQQDTNIIVLPLPELSMS